MCNYYRCFITEIYTSPTFPDTYGATKHLDLLGVFSAEPGKDSY
jgi:hypothetical protein